MNIDAILNQQLTPEQRVAAIDPAAEVLTLACAGSGKSRTLAYRIAWLLSSGAEPASIVAFTFTEKAAESIKLQVARALTRTGFDPTAIGAMYIGTIHSYCKALLGEMDARYRQFEVLDENRLILYLVSRYGQLGLNALSAVPRNGRTNHKYFQIIREVSAAWKIMNDELIDLSDIELRDPDLGGVLRSLSDRLDASQYIDFSLMIRRVVDALQAGELGILRAIEKLEHLMVDEYQDVNPAQEALIRELHRHSRSLFVVGDDDQSIYAWRGADVNNILGFSGRYPGCATHTLARNFRSTPAIVLTADSFAAAELGATRITKNPQAVQPPGPRDLRRLWFPDRSDEADWVVRQIQLLLGTAHQESDGTIRGLTPGDFAVLMRSTKSEEQNNEPRHAAFTSRLTALNISYSLEAGGSVFDRPQVSVLRDTFELLRNQQPTREIARQHFDGQIRPVYPRANFDQFAHVLAEWGRMIHGAIGGARRRVYPQKLVHDLLRAFGIAESNFDAAIMQDLGIFSKMIQDVESVYLSVDSARRFQEILNFLNNVADSGYDSSTDDVLRRPDAVTVSTVHRVKGLEFPVVFVVDVEGQRFPGRRHNYNGWLPTDIMQNAIARGAYQSTPPEEARLFYTALTRAERYLYVTGSAQLPAAVRPKQVSSFARRMNHAELSDDPNLLVAGLVPHPQARRIDETVVPTSYSDIKYYLRCPRDYQFRKSFGFSPSISEMFGFGLTVHTAIGKLHELFPNQAPTAAAARDVTENTFHLKHIPPSRDPQNHPGGYERAKDAAIRIVQEYVADYHADFARKRQVEARFEIPAQQAVISGSIDLMLQMNQAGQILEATVIDFKAIEGGDEPERNEDIQWTELSLQVQLYAKAAREVLGENAQTGAVHLLKDNQRVEVPVDPEAITAAIQNVEWAVDRILSGDFPMRPHDRKCQACDFNNLCSKSPQAFATNVEPPELHTPNGRQRARAFSEFQ